jgi:hypothetical protein
MTEGTFKQRRFDRKKPPAIAAPPLVPEIIQDDHGRFRFSFADDARSFETVTFALAVAASEMQRARVSA